MYLKRDLGSIQLVANYVQIFKLDNKQTATTHVRWNLHTRQVAMDQARAYPGFCSTNQLGVLQLPPEWDASPSQGYPSIKLSGTHLYTRVERSTVTVKPRREH